MLRQRFYSSSTADTPPSCLLVQACALRRVVFLLIAAVAFVSIVTGSPAFAAPLADVKTSALNVSLSSSGSQAYALSVQPLPGKVNGKIQTDVLLIENPLRLVVDIPGVPSKTSQNVTVKSANVTGLRIGVHKEKTRVVIDIAGNEKPEYEVRDSGVIAFTFGGASAPAEDSSVESEPAQESEPDLTGLGLTTPEPEKTPKGAAAEEEAPEWSAEPSPKATPTPKPTPTEAPRKDADQADSESADPDIPAITAQPGTSVVKAIYYQTMNNTTVPAVVFDMEGLDTYALNKKKPDQYELVIQNAHLGGKHLLLPQFPPDSFKGFSVIVASEEGGNVFVKIYVEENVKLFPFTAKGQLWLKVAE